MIQDIGSHKLNNHYECREPKETDVMMFLKDGNILCMLDEDDKKISFPICSDIPDPSNSIYLFTIDDCGYYLYHGECSVEGYRWYKLRDLNRGQVTDNLSMMAAYTAYHLQKWYADNRYCGRCGNRTVLKNDERALICPECGNVIYPRINPAVIIGVTNGDRLLITRYAAGYGYNALVAGFTEIGETLEETVKREVKEETGLNVKNIRYYKSQPWGIAQDILAGFFCEVDGDDSITMDQSELKYAEWVKREDIVLQPTEFSLTNEMMMKFKKGQ